MAKYLDINGLAEVWAKVKAHVASGYIAKSGDGSISGSLSVQRQITSASLGTGMISATGSTNIPGIYLSGNVITYGSSSVVNGDASYELATKKDIADLVNSAPTTLDTLGEVAKAIQDNESVVEALDEAIGNKLDKSGGSISGSLSVSTSVTASTVQANSMYSKDKGMSAGVISFSTNGKAVYTLGTAEAGNEAYEIATKKDLSNITLETLTTSEIEAICV